MVEAVGSVRVIPAVASGGSFLGFLTACFLVIYPDVEPNNSEQDQDSEDLPGESDPHGEKNGELKLALLKVRDGVNSQTTENHSVTWTVQLHSERGQQEVDASFAEIWLGKILFSGGLIKQPGLWIKLLSLSCYYLSS